VASETNVGRWAVIAAALVGGFFFVQRLIADDPLYTAFIKGMGGAFAVMVVVGTARRFWRGDKVSGAQGPGFGLNFARAALRPLRTLDERVNQQMNAMSGRVDVLERDVGGLKESAPQPEHRD
jgi:hypothetical protein